MQEQDDFEKEVFEKIKNTYFVKLVGGSYTSKESFWAIDDSQKEYYISPLLVKENNFLIQELESHENTYWALIQDLVWNSGEWSGKKVSSLMMLTSEKTSCELFKKILKEHWEYNFAQIKKNEEAIELVSKNPFTKGTDQLISESEQLNRMSKVKEEELSTICKGWQDIDR